MKILINSVCLPEDDTRGSKQHWTDRVCDYRSCYLILAVNSIDGVFSWQR